MSGRRLVSGALAAALLAMASSAGATVIASSTFDSGDEGWTQGEFTGPEPAPGGPMGVVHDPAGFIVIDHDHYSYAGFLAPTKFLGDLTGAIGGTLSFDLSDAYHDLRQEQPGSGWTAYVSFYGANGRLIYGGLEDRLPGTTSRTHFEMALTADKFFTDGDPTTGSGPDLGGRAVTQEEFLEVMGNVARLGIPADFSSSAEDYSTLDNVVLTSGVPEPAGWAMMLGGFGLLGAALRRRRALAIA